MSIPREFDVYTAKKIIKRLDTAGIRFKIDTDDSSIKNMNAVTANRGGTFGLGIRVFFTIHPDDIMDYEDVCNRLFSPPEKKPEKDWRDRLKGI